MTSLEKEIKVKEVLSRMCRYGDGCSDCDFFDPDDSTDEGFFCAIRDSKNLIPFDDMWDMNSAMKSDRGKRGNFLHIVRIWLRHSRR